MQNKDVSCVYPLELPPFKYKYLELLDPKVTYDSPVKTTCFFMLFIGNYMI